MIHFGHRYSKNQGVFPMLTRIRPLVVRPWIKRPRGIAILVAAVAILTNSSAFAQRGGGGCGGMSGGGGGSPGGGGTGGFGVAGGQGGMGGGFGNQNPMMQTQMAQMQRTQQGFFNVPPMQGADDFGGDYRTQLAARKAFLAAQAEQRKQRLAARKEKQTKYVASRTRSTTSK